MNRVTQFFDMVDQGQEHLARRKNFYMAIFIVLVSSYVLFTVKPKFISIELMFELVIGMIPIIAITSATIDCITLNGKNFYIKVGTRMVIYLSLYFILNLIQNMLF